jgi:hypothetical protein
MDYNGRREDYQLHRVKADPVPAEAQDLLSLVNIPSSH